MLNWSDKGNDGLQLNKREKNKLFRRIADRVLSANFTYSEYSTQPNLITIACTNTSLAEKRSPDLTTHTDSFLEADSFLELTPMNLV